jgi:L-threonylcarbamoyladenylate synthase
LGLWCVERPDDGNGLGAGVVWSAQPQVASQAAHDLFSVLRELDARGVQQIWVQLPPDTPDWEGVRDRLQRAAA